jgi:hypothetical protein
VFAAQLNVERHASRLKRLSSPVTGHLTWVVARDIRRSSLASSTEYRYYFIPSSHLHTTLAPTIPMVSTKSNSLPLYWYWPSVACPRVTIVDGLSRRPSWLLQVVLTHIAAVTTPFHDHVLWLDICRSRQHVERSPTFEWTRQPHFSLPDL